MDGYLTFILILVPNRFLYFRSGLVDFHFFVFGIAMICYGVFSGCNSNLI